MRYPLVIYYIAMVFRWPIEIDGLPFLKMVDLSSSLTVCHNQRVFLDDFPINTSIYFRDFPWLTVRLISKMVDVPQFVS